METILKETKNTDPKCHEIRGKIRRKNAYNFNFR